MSISLRSVTSDDDGFLREVYASARAPELAMVPWTDEQRTAFLKMQFDAQDSYYHSQFPAAEFLVIMNGPERIGRLYVLRKDDEIRILDVTILPESRSAGIGTSLIEELLAESVTTNKRLTIWIESFNPSQNLFRRLGFSVVREDGFNHLFEFRGLAHNQSTV